MRFEQFYWHFLRVHGDWLTLHTPPTLTRAGQGAALRDHARAAVDYLVGLEDIVVTDESRAGLAEAVARDMAEGTYSGGPPSWRPFLPAGLRLGLFRDAPRHLERFAIHGPPPCSMAVYNGRAEGALILTRWEDRAEAQWTLNSPRQDSLAEDAERLTRAAGYALAPGVRDPAAYCIVNASRPGPAAGFVEWADILRDVLGLRDGTRAQFEFYEFDPALLEALRRG